MVYSYYPGCTLKNKAQDLDRYARMSAEALGFSLQEIEEWQCCGAVYPLASDEIATKLSAVRALNDAKEKGQDLVTLCSACHHVIKRVNDDMQNVEDIRTRANNYLNLAEPYEGETKVLHYLEVLRDEVGFDEYVSGEGVSLIEWANLIEEILPENRVNITIEKDLEQGFDFRKITIEERRKSNV